MKIAWLFVVTALLAGCGGSGSPGAGVILPPPSSATLEFSTLAGSTETIVNGIDFTLRLPAGVTVAADGRTGEVSPDALQSTTGRGLIAAKYIPATASSPASVLVNVVDAVGFPIGRFATLTCKVASGTTVNRAGFTFDSFSAVGMSGNNTVRLDGVTPLLTVRTQ